VFRCFIDSLPASRAQSAVAFYAHSKPFIIPNLALRIYLGFVSNDSSPADVEKIKSLMRAQKGKIMSTKDQKLLTDPILIYNDVFAVNTPDGVQLDGFFDLSFCVSRASELQDCFSQISKDLERIKRSLSKYASPKRDAISIVTPMPSPDQIRQSLKQSLQPIVASGALKLSATVTDYICDFILHLFHRDVEGIIYEIWDVNKLVVRSGDNRYFDVFDTWDEEAEQRGWESPAFDDES
jgi:hypothetical protein